jgi:uncharacterized membrane protein YphA (DoxX/SURF4 family)
MKFLTLLLYIAIIAAVLTAVIGIIKKGHKHWLMTFLQNFCGVLFIVSGFVKAVDPMGTAFKMEQYFTEFQYTFAETGFKFLAPLFPLLSSISLFFSITMIVLEIVVGVMLILGHRPRLTSWIFLLLIFFFTILTGFTYMTGYVPSGTNFFSFSAWGPYTETNMRVTDCGCFGDFIKLVPKISFFKDLGLLIPAFYFVFRHRDMHQLFTFKTRRLIVAGVTIFLVLFCLYNSLWNLPVVDFRPFKVGTDLYQKKLAEEEAMASVKIIAWKLKNKTTGEVKELPNQEYMSNLAKYPKEEWSVVDQVKSKPAIESTKVSEFSVTSVDGFDVSEDILTDSNDVFMIVAYKLNGDSYPEETMVTDTVWKLDTILVGNDSMKLVKSIDTIQSRKAVKEVYAWDEGYVRKYMDKVNPLMQDVMNQGAKVYAIAGGAGEEKLKAFKEAVGGGYEWYEADDILLKTIIRSNPGVVHLKAGKVLDMWHIRHLPKTLKLNTAQSN